MSGQWQIVSSSHLGLEFVVVGAAAFALGWYLGRRQTPGITMDALMEETVSKGALQVEKLADNFEDFKMVLVVRNDLKMGKGKIAAQCGHATLGMYKKVLRRAPKALRRWEESAQVKVVTKVDSEEEMIAMKDKAKELGVPTHVTIDAGRTQIAPNSRTVMALLGPDHLIDEVSGHLKLL